MDPFAPHYLVAQGVSEYVLAPAGSDGEKEGEADMRAGIALDPYHFGLYQMAAQAYAAKGNKDASIALYKEAYSKVNGLGRYDLRPALTQLGIDPDSLR